MITRRGFFRTLLCAGALATARLYAPSALKLVSVPRPQPVAARPIPIYMYVGDSQAYGSVIEKAVRMSMED